MAKERHAWLLATDSVPFNLVSSRIHRTTQNRVVQYVEPGRSAPANLSVSVDNKQIVPRKFAAKTVAWSVDSTRASPGRDVEALPLLAVKMA